VVPDHISGEAAALLVVLVVVAVLLVGLLILQGRQTLNPPQSAGADSGPSLVRSWLAVSLVMGLLIFCAVVLAISDASLRSTLFGGLIASAGAAVAFYFSSKDADQARKDILNAAFGLEDVPQLVGRTVADAMIAMAPIPLELAVNPLDAAPKAVISQQQPPAGATIRGGGRVVALVQVPDIRGKPVVDAKQMQTEGLIQLTVQTPEVEDAWVIDSQTPAPGSPMSSKTTITVTAKRS